MARINRPLIHRLLLVIISMVPIAQSQTVPTVQQKSEKSACSNIVAVTGDININCSNLTPAQRKALKDIPEILRTALTNQDYLEAIMAKLDEMSKARPVVTNNAPGGFAVSGGTILNPTVTNNYAEKLPNILGFQIVTSTSPDTQLPDFNAQAQGHPVTSFKFYVDAAWNDPQFAAVCDRPCHALDIRLAKPEGVSFSPNFAAGQVPDHPEWAVFIVNIRPIQTFRYYLFSVASNDDKPVSIVKFGRFAATHRVPQ